MKKTDLLIGVIIGIALVTGIVSVVSMNTTGEKGSGLGDEYTYDISDYAKTDTEKILYEETGKPLSTGLKNTRAIAVGADGAVCVAGENVIQKDGKSIITFDESPMCLTVTPDGKIYVGLKDHVQVFDASGKQIAKFNTLGEKAVLTSIAVSKDNVFVADAGNRVVIHYDTDGKFINEIGKKDEKRNIGGFVIPSPYFDLAVASDGLLRVTNPGEHRIEAYTFDGDLEFWWGEPSIKIEGFCGCCNPINFAIAPNGNFITCEKGLMRVKEYDPVGKFLGVVAGTDMLVKGDPASACRFPRDRQAGGFDVAVDNAGKVYILDTIDNSVRTFVIKSVIDE